MHTHALERATSTNNSENNAPVGGAKVESTAKEERKRHLLYQAEQLGQHLLERRNRRRKNAQKLSTSLKPGSEDFPKDPPKQNQIETRNNKQQTNLNLLQQYSR